MGKGKNEIILQVGRENAEIRKKKCFQFYLSAFTSIQYNAVFVRFSVM